MHKFENKKVTVGHSFFKSGDGEADIHIQGAFFSDLSRQRAFLAHKYCSLL